MESMAMWEKVLVGIVAVLVLLWFRPGLKAAMESSRKSENRDWRAVLIPLALVVAFVALLIALV